MSGIQLAALIVAMIAWELGLLLPSFPRSPRGIAKKRPRPSAAQAKRRARRKPGIVSVGELSLAALKEVR